MFKNNVYTFRNFPVEEKQRKWTDCCCTIVGAIFALTLFIISFIFFTKNNYYEVNFPVDRTGQACYYTQTDAPFIYFQNLNDLTSQRYCVTQCPLSGEVISCSSKNPCSGITSTYESTQIINSLGGVCEPTNPTLQQKFWSNNILSDKINLIGGYNVILWTLLIGFCVGLIYLILVVLLPRVMTFTAFILAFIALVIGGIILIVQPIKLLGQSGNTWNIVIGVICFVLALFILIFFFCYNREIEVASIFMYYSNVFLKENLIIFAYIALFLLLSAGLVVLCIWQYIAFGTWQTPYLNPGDLFYSSGNNMFFQVLNAIEFIWGIQFLKDSFAYIVSGNAVEWYFNYREHRPAQCSRPFTRFISRNFGSVVGGSFLNAFFSFFSIIFDIFRCDPKGQCGCASKCCRNCCCCFTCLFQLVRTDPYAYIHLSGVPFCDAARQCQAICEQSHLFSSEQSCIRLYRLSVPIFLTILTALISFILLKGKTSYANFIIVGLIVLTAYLVVNYFADIHSNAAQGLAVCYLAESNCESPRNINVCPDQLRYEINAFEQKYDLHPL